MLNTTRTSNQDNKKVPGNTAAVFCAPLILLVCLLAICWPGFSGDWYLDDFSNIHENQNVHLQSLTAPEIARSFYGRDLSHSRINRPVAYLSLALNYYCGETDPLGYHIVNFTIHAATAIFLFFFALQILRLPVLKQPAEHATWMVALLATLLWATHPIQVNAVTYVVQRMAALAALFSLLALYCYMKARLAQQATSGTARGWYAACVLAGLGAIASKENAAMLPFSLLLLEATLIGPLWKPGNARRLAWIGLPGVIILLLPVICLGGLEAALGGYGSRPFSLTERMLTQPRILFFYIGQLLHPSGAPFTLLHDFTVSTSLVTPWTTLPAILLLAAGSVIFLWGSRKWPLLAFCYLFFQLNHAIEGSILPLELVFEHRNYLPTLFFFLPLAVGCSRAIRYFAYRPLLRGFLLLGIGVWLAGQAHTTHRLNTLFQHPVAFWTNNVALYPQLHRPRHNLGKSLLIYGKTTEAETQLYKSLAGKSSGQTAHKFITHYNLGVYYCSGPVKTDTVLSSIV